MQVEISDEIYEKYRDLIKQRFLSDDVSRHVQSLVERELLRFMAPGYDIDHLTGCKTWYQLQAHISHLTHGSGWQDKGLLQKSYLCVDIHNFKDYNDRHGMVESDTALVKVAEALYAAYPQCILYRARGGKFVVELHEESLANVKHRLEIALKFAIVRVVVRKNQPKNWFVNKAILFNIEEAFIKATQQGVTLIHDYTSI